MFSTGTGLFNVGHDISRKIFVRTWRQSDRKKFHEIFPLIFLFVGTVYLITYDRNGETETKDDLWYRPSIVPIAPSQTFHIDRTYNFYRFYDSKGFG